jgi:hypothetical protein
MRGFASGRTAIVRRVAPTGSLMACVLLALAVGSQVAAATSPPSVYTGEGAELTTSSATLKGSIDPDNQQTSYYFQWGQSTAYGEQTPSTPLGSGTQTIHVSVPIAGLTAYTTYHYRLVAVGALHTTDGQDRTFTTKKIPLTFTVAPIPSRDVFGSPFSVDGTLSGTGSAGHAVVLEANPFPFLAGFKAVGNPEMTGPGGSFSFSVPGLPQNTQLRVATLETPPVNSPVAVELVAVRVTLHLRPTGRHGYARLYGTVTPAEVGALVSFQLLRPDGRPVAVSSTVITSGSADFSRFSRVVRIRRSGLYRAYVRVASGAQVSNDSRAILIG